VRQHRPTEGHVVSGRARLYYREVGAGRPVIVLHGGPDFDHRYLLPELDRLSDQVHLVYYDQRGRGRSGIGVRSEDVTIASEMADLNELRRHLGFASVAVLGHSWGGLLAMEYATRHPDRVSQLILMNTAPATAAGWEAQRDHLHRLRTPIELQQMQAIAASDAFRSGEIDAEMAYYRLFFRHALAPELIDPIVDRLRAHLTAEDVRRARAIEDRLYDETAASRDYDLLPRLRALNVPTLVLHGAQDFIPAVVAAQIAEAIPGAALAVLPGCRHFAYLEKPELVHEQIVTFVGSGKRPR
jgi:proline iminopeptidase